ncbi:MAG: ABC transporter substrate-binding protein [Bacteriovoracaceae bacterium]|nr:ABC transporter substrate-binding protein [Bacteriovoracaceae bacterium]
MVVLGVFSAFIIRDELAQFDDTKVPLKITLGIQENVLSALPIIADQRGLFRNNGVKVEFKTYVGDEETVQALSNGEVDLAFTSTIPFMIESLENEKLRILAGTGFTDKAHVVVATKSDGQGSATQILEGDTVGTIKDTAASIFFKIFVKIHNIPDVKVRYYQKGELTNAFIGGEVDAVALRVEDYEQVKDTISDEQLTVFEPDFFRLYAVLASSEEFLNKRSKAAEAFMQSLVQAERFLYSNPSKSKTILLNYFGSSKEEIINIEWKSYRYILSLGESLLLALESAQRLYLETNPDAVIVRFLPLIEPSLLAKEKPYSVTIRQ